jgi:casein kinase I family protein HRR25
MLDDEKIKDFEFETQINNGYKIIEKIGEGSFGHVYKGINLKTNEFVAVKIESDFTKSKVLNNEAKILKHLSKNNYVPNLKWFGKLGNFRYIIIDLLGKSLLDSRDSFKKNITLCKYMLITITEIIESIHKYSLIYRDIKPENFLYDLNDKTKVYIIDFGLCKSYLKSDKSHIIQDRNGHYTGTIRYSSIFIHEGYNHSRRDDLISVAYMILYLYDGTLPWCGIKETNVKKRFNFIMNIKKEKLDQGCELDFIDDYIQYCYNLNFDEKPNYDRLIKNI